MENVVSSAPVADSSQAAPTQVDTNVQPGQVVAPKAPIAPPVPKRIKEIKYKANGKDYTEALPFEIEDNPQHVEYLTKQFELSRAAQKAMQENSSVQKQVQALFNSLKGDTANTLKQMGIDPKEFAASIVEEEIKKSQMSPEQLERMELQQQVKKLENERKREQEEYQKRELEQRYKQDYERVENQMIQAIEKTDLPRSPYVVKKIADKMLVGVQNGVDLTPDEVMPLVREEILNDIKSLFEALPADAAENLIGKDFLNNIRKKNIAKAKQTGATAKSNIKDVSKAPTIAKDVGPKQNYKDFFKF